MKTLRQIVSIILFLTFGASAVINILFLYGAASRELSQIGLIAVITVLFLASLLGLILKNIRKDDVYPINIITPVKELGIFYIGLMIAWTAIYFITMLSR
jgi:hypothetical protein